MFNKEIFNDLLNKTSKRLFLDDEWKFPTDIVQDINNLKTLHIRNCGQEVKNSMVGNPDNPYNYIEHYLKQKKHSRNSIEGIRMLRESKSPIDSLPDRKLYEYALNTFVDRIVSRPRLPGYNLSLATDEFSSVIRQVIDYDEDGYKTKVIPRIEFLKKMDQTRLILKTQNETMTIGDYFESPLIDNVKEFDNKGNLIGYYSECLVSPIFKHFRSMKNYYESENSRIFGFLKPYLMKSRFFSLKIVDESLFPGTIIIPASLTRNAKCGPGDRIHMLVFDTYEKDGNVLKYGAAKTIEEKYNEYLLWNLNNHFFLRYELKKWQHTYKEMIDLKSQDSFLQKLKTYRLCLNPTELKHKNIIDGEQNNGLIINKLLRAQMSILYL